MHVESGIPNLEFRTVYNQPFLSQRWAHSHHCNRKYLRFELSIWSILDIYTGQLNQHLKFLVHVKTNTGIYTVSIPFPCFLPELLLCLSLVSDFYQMATGSNIITSMVCYFHCIALFIHMQGLQHWPVSLLLSASSCAVSDIVPMDCTLYGCVVCKTPVMPHLQYSHRHLLQIMQLLAMLFLEWSVAFNAVQILTAMFCPTLDSDGTIVCVEGEILTAANVDSLVTVDGGFNYLNT